MYKGKCSNISISLVGDVLLSKRLPSNFSSELASVSHLMMQHECRIGNLETTVHYPEEGYPEAYPGGSYAMMSPHGLSDLKQFGFNFFSTANNHSMDYSHDGLLATLNYLRKADIPYAGTGKNLGEAARPAFFDCSNGRVALIGITASFHDSYLAGPQNQDLQGRPGVNPLRHHAVYELGEADFDTLVRIASETGINSYHDQAMKEGYLIKNEKFNFGAIQFTKGKSGILHTTPHEGDLKRTVDSVKDAKCFSDVVIVSIHAHQFKYSDKKSPPDFVRIFAHKCIEAGADIIVCHGPHLLRGIEMYKKGIIFHGLGNFILQHDQMNVLPEEQYIKYGTTRQNSRGEGEIYALQTKNNTRGLNVVPETWRSIVASIDSDEDMLKVRIYPIVLDRYGVCNASDDISIIEEIKRMSEEYDTVLEIDMRDKSGYLEINKNE